jgi:hypothetical protein
MWCSSCWIFAEPFDQEIAGGQHRAAFMQRLCGFQNYDAVKAFACFPKNRCIIRLDSP